MQAMRSGVNIKMPVMEKSCENLVDFSEFVTKSYIAVTEGDKEIIKSLFGEVSFIAAEELAFITPEMSEGAQDEAISALTKAGITVKSRIRLL
jgi:hypothetical protein